MVTHKQPALSLWNRVYPWIGLLGGIALAACQWMIFVFAPMESTMGMTQKIFYIHMPLAWWAMISFFIVFVASIVYLVRRSAFCDALAHAAAFVGLLLALLALVTGSVWARYAWGHWWLWEPRLTTTLVMCFIYAGYLIIRQMDLPDAKKNAIAAVVGIVAFLDVPLVFVSARIWGGVHPPSIGLDPDMKATVIACLLAFGLIWISMLSAFCRQNILDKRVARLRTEQLLKAQ